jgi:uncharacterized membrane protein YqjE
MMLARVAWHKPLAWLAVAMVALAAVSVVGLVVDPRVITGAPLWAKPLKFANSIAVYALTLSWLIGLLRRGTRLAWWAGTVSAVFLAVEAVIIVGAAVAGHTSHFTVDSPLATALWAIMAVSISIVWAAALPVAIPLLRTPLGDRGRTIAIRAGFVIALVGMALAFLMTSPTAEQVADYRGIVGAHTVGLADGGPGLPILGWSTVGGDLRIPHFVGMHALQLLPLAAIALEAASTKIIRLRDAAIRARIVAVLTVLYAGVLVVVTVQALSGQSIVRPDAATVATTTVLFAGAAVGVVWSLRRRSAGPPTRHDTA